MKPELQQKQPPAENIAPILSSALLECWVVVFSNYEPSKVDSLWATAELANARAKALNGAAGDWNVEKWEIGQHSNSEIRRPGPDAPEQNSRRQPGSPASNG